MCVQGLPGLAETALHPCRNVRQVLRAWYGQGHRALVFAQTQQMLDIVEKAVEAEGAWTMRCCSHLLDSRFHAPVPDPCDSRHWAGAARDADTSPRTARPDTQNFGLQRADSAVRGLPTCLGARV